MYNQYNNVYIQPMDEIIKIKLNYTEIKQEYYKNIHINETDT